MINAILHMRVIPYVGEPFDAYRKIQMPMVCLGMYVYGARTVPEGCDQSEDRVESISYALNTVDCVAVDLGTDDHREPEPGDEDKFLREHYSHDALVATYYKEWYYYKDKP